LRDGIIGGAVLDVFPQEPLPATSELYGMNNVLMTYHCADKTKDYWDRTLQVYAAELNRYLNSLPLVNVIDKTKGY
jgi:phosphoglycerate dehydrogenase-like enzyme